MTTQLVSGTSSVTQPYRRGNQIAIPCWFMRGGTSRGPFFRAVDLPTDRLTRDDVLLAVMGSPDPRQIDGLGGAHSLTSKVGIVDLSDRENIDLEFTFAQLQPDSDAVDTSPNCGNMLAAVVPFAIESGLFTPTADTTTARVLTRNTGMVAEITILTPDGPCGRFVDYEGDTRVDGVPGTAAAVSINFLDTAGSVAPGLLPTGTVRNRVNIEGTGVIDVTCIDNGMPLVILHAEAVGATGYETPADLNGNEKLKNSLESLRLVCGHLMGLGDVTKNNYPKMTLVSNAIHDGSIHTRSFIPHICHESIGVLAAVTVATACMIDGSVARDVAQIDDGPVVTVSVEHPAGEFSVELGLHPTDSQQVTKSALVRTARLIMAGNVFIPSHHWNLETSDAVPASAGKDLK